MIIRGGKSVAAFLLNPWAAPSSVAAIRLNHSASPGKEVSTMVLFGANSGYFARLLCLLYHIAAIW